MSLNRIIPLLLLDNYKLVKTKILKTNMLETQKIQLNYLMK